MAVYSPVRTGPHRSGSGRRSRGEQRGRQGGQGGRRRREEERRAGPPPCGLGSQAVAWKATTPWPHYRIACLAVSLPLRSSSLSRRRERRCALPATARAAFGIEATCRRGRPSQLSPCPLISALSGHPAGHPRGLTLVGCGVAVPSCTGWRAASLRCRAW